MKGYEAGVRTKPTKEIPGSKYKADKELEVRVWNAVYTFKQDGSVVITPHEQL